MQESYYNYMGRRMREEELSKKYVMVTAVSTFRQRYCIPMDELQAENTDMTVDPLWALDAVTCDEVNEFSQLHIGELIVDHEVLSEEEALAMYDRDNDYLKDLDVDKKVRMMRDWKRSEDNPWN
tara:strand:+ start:740 stop:1111 length:372 start_codon:yes stop_codon:yes gene_type:complete